MWGGIKFIILNQKNSKIKKIKEKKEKKNSKRLKNKKKKVNQDSLFIQIRIEKSKKTKSVECLSVYLLCWANILCRRSSASRLLSSKCLFQPSVCSRYCFLISSMSPKIWSLEGGGGRSSTVPVVFPVFLASSFLSSIWSSILLTSLLTFSKTASFSVKFFSGTTSRRQKITNQI